MSIPKELRYSDQHEWVRIADGIATIGITDFAQESLGDVVFIELPEPGDTISRGDSVCEVESVKAVSDVYAPFSGEIVEVNEDLEGNEEVVNQDPYGEGWLFRIKPTQESELDDLMDAGAYKAFVARQDA